MSTQFPGQCVTDAWLAGIPLAHICSRMEEDGYDDDLIMECMELYDSLDEWFASGIVALQATCPHDWKDL